MATWIRDDWFNRSNLVCDTGDHLIDRRCLGDMQATGTKDSPELANRYRRRVTRDQPGCRDDWLHRLGFDGANRCSRLRLNDRFDGWRRLVRRLWRLDNSGDDYRFSYDYRFSDDCFRCNFCHRRDHCWHC